MNPHQARALDRLITETRLLFRELRGVADRVHAESESAARRSILFDLVRDGARTVPALADVRNVSRQAVQVLVDALATDGLVERIPNPSHKRSWLWRATAAGAEKARVMHATEHAVLGQLEGLPGVVDLDAASEVLASLRETLSDTA